VPSAGWRIREIPNRASSPKTHKCDQRGGKNAGGAFQLQTHERRAQLRRNLRPHLDTNYWACAALRGEANPNKDDLEKMRGWSHENNKELSHEKS
jgi:hypothetical protein